MRTIKQKLHHHLLQIDSQHTDSDFTSSLKKEFKDNNMYHTYLRLFSQALLKKKTISLKSRSLHNMEYYRMQIMLQLPDQRIVERKPQQVRCLYMSSQ